MQCTNTRTHKHISYYLGALFQECNFDLQCPDNAFCSTKKHGCLCQNGFGPTTVNYDGNEVISCLPKLCTNSSTCESEYHQCEDNKCKCLATHFDPTSAKCYKFGSTGGQPSDDSVLQPTITEENNSGVFTIFRDLTEGSDKLWLILLILILSIVVFLLIFLVLLKKNCFGPCCWTANKNEYEPNNKNGTLKNGNSFDKNSINNKSFRKKTSETDDDLDDTTAADRSSLVAGSKENKEDKKSKKNKQARSSEEIRAQAPSDQTRYVVVNMNDDNPGQQKSSQKVSSSPLASSTSTPV